MAILGRDLPCVHGRVDSQLTEEGKRVRDVDLGYVPGDRMFDSLYVWETFVYLLPVSVDVFDKGVGDPVPGERLTSGSSKQRMVAKMSGCVDHLLFFG